jgi:HSP20 family protein
MDTNNHNEPERRQTNALAKRLDPLATLVTPVADIYETADNFTIKLDMPGVPKESVSVTAEPGRLAAKGEVVAQHLEGGTLLFSEIGRKSYVREFNLGEGVDHNNVQAQMQDGVLVITVPKSDAMKAREIIIR